MFGRRAKLGNKNALFFFCVKRRGVRQKKGEACGLLLLYYEILNLLLLLRRKVLYLFGCEFHCGVGIGLGAVDVEDYAAVDALYHVEQHLGVGVLLGWRGDASKIILSNCSSESFLIFPSNQ